MTPTPLNDPPLGIVLAAGAGSRFAGSMHKLLAPIDSVSVIRRSVSVALAAAESGHLSDVVVVIPARDADGDALRYELAGLVCRFAANPDPTIGIAGSLTACSTPRAVIFFPPAVPLFGSIPSSTSPRIRTVASFGGTTS